MFAFTRKKCYFGILPYWKSGTICEQERKRKEHNIYIFGTFSIFSVLGERAYFYACNPLIIPTLQIKTIILQRDVTNPQPRAGLEPGPVGDQLLCAFHITMRSTEQYFVKVVFWKQ